MFNYNLSNFNKSFIDVRNNLIIDTKFGDVNGDRTPDIVYLVGDKNQNPFYENIKLIIEDGITKYPYVAPLLPNYDRAYDPWIILTDFIGNQVEDIFISLPTGGSGGLTQYYAITFLNNRAAYILTPKWYSTVNDTLGFEVIYKDYYKVEIISKKLDKTFIIDVSSRRNFYEGTVYNKFHKLIRPLRGFILDPTFSYPIKLNGNEPTTLMVLQDIAGTSHADSLGVLVSYWSYSHVDSKWKVNTNLIGIQIPQR